MKPDEAETALAAARQHKDMARWRRFGSQPVKSSYPLLLKMSGATRELEAQTFWGGRMTVLLPEPVSRSIYRFGYFDHSVCRFLLASLRRGDTYVDIGAHYGFFALLASWRIGPDARLICFEPMPDTWARLQHNLQLNKIGNGTLIKAAAFDSNCTLEFQNFGSSDSSYNSAFQSRDASMGAEAIVPVQARRCDDVFDELKLERVDVIKVDAESSELHVLRGAEASIEKFKPLLIVELGDFDLPGVPLSREIVDWITAKGYVPYEADGETIQRHMPQERYSYANILFVPSAKVEWFNAQIDC